MKRITDDFIPLTPIIHDWITDTIQNKAHLKKIIEKEGSPINIHCLDPFVENLNKYQRVFEQYHIKHKIYFARKANKSLAFAVKANKEHQGVDTASYRELKQCLDAGIPSEALLLTAAIKNRKLMELAVDNRVTVVLDNIDELELLKDVAAEKQRTVPVMIRLGGFEHSGIKMHSRFGFSLDEAFGVILTVTENENRLQYKGLHFHLNGYSIEERAVAIEQSIGLVDRLSAHNITTYSLDIGGGFLINYLSDKKQWEVFHEELKKAILTLRKPITYRNDTLGVVKIDGNVYGEPKIYPYYNEVHKDKFLESILTSRSEEYKKPIYQLINDRQLTIHIEPGRSLMDQAGITVAKVAFRKKDSEGNLMIGLEMNHSQLKSSSADFLLDPMHLSFNKSGDNESGCCEGFLVGAYCLEQELILKRKIRFSQYPEIGDLIVFPNTAGYMMHFFESEAHLFELAKNLFYCTDRGEIKDE